MTTLASPPTEAPNATTRRETRSPRPRICAASGKRTNAGLVHSSPFGFPTSTKPSYQVVEMFNPRSARTSRK